MEKREEKKIIESKEVSAKEVSKASQRSKKERAKTKFVMDMSGDESKRREINDLLMEINNKDFGENISFKELVLYLLKKITKKDIENLQEDSVSKMEKVHRALKEFNEKNSTNLSLADFLVKQLKI